LNLKISTFVELLVQQNQVIAGYKSKYLKP
jgi:hypothetical protein